MFIYPKDITVEDVVGELEQIIARYPDRVGGDTSDAFRGAIDCVYFKDEDGKPVSTEGRSYDGPIDIDSVELVQPVCIVGQWIEEFHPEFKNIPEIKLFLVENRTIGSLGSFENPFTEEVAEVLMDAQGQQDDGRTWSRIELDYNPGVYWG